MIDISTLYHTMAAVALQCAVVYVIALNRGDFHCGTTLPFNDAESVFSSSAMNIGVGLTIANSYSMRFIKYAWNVYPVRT